MRISTALFATAAVAVAASATATAASTAGDTDATLLTNQDDTEPLTIEDEFEALKNEAHLIEEAEMRARLKRLRERRLADPPPPHQDAIEHFVVLIVENHSFDQVGQSIRPHRSCYLLPHVSLRHILRWYFLSTATNMKLFTRANVYQQPTRP